MARHSERLTIRLTEDELAELRSAVEVQDGSAGKSFWIRRAVMQWVRSVNSGIVAMQRRTSGAAAARTILESLDQRDPRQVEAFPEGSAAVKREGGQTT